MSKIVVMGLPESGKTTFLAALWHLLDSKEIKTELSLKSYDADLKYLNLIRNSWLQCKKPQRTSELKAETVRLTLNDPSNREIVVVIPDIKGEEFDEQWAQRYCSVEHEKNVGSMSGMILFIHPGNIIPHKTIHDAQQILDELKKISSHNENKKPDEDQSETSSEEQDLNLPFNPNNCPTQVKLVDNLQVVQQQTNLKSVNLAIVISAWDLTGESNPKKWLADNLPLLNQFLENNDLFKLNYFGISAQGGELSDAERLLSLPCPSERIGITFEESPQSSDLTRIILWTSSI